MSSITILESLKKAKIPANVISILAQTDLNNVTRDDILNIKGVANKRADVIMAAIELEKAKNSVTMRISKKVESKTKAFGYNVKFFTKDQLWAGLPQLKYLSEYRFERYEKKANGKYVKLPEDLGELHTAKALFKSMLDALDEYHPVLKIDDALTVRMMRSDMSDIFMVNYTSPKPTEHLFTVEYAIQNVFELDWHLFDNDQSAAQKKQDALYRKICQKLAREGVTIVGEDTTIEAKLIDASSSHLKKEVGVFADRASIKANEFALFFGWSEDNFWKLGIDGVSLMKMRAIFMRPNSMPLTANNKVLTLDDVLVVKSVSKVYIVKNGVKIGRITKKYTANKKLIELKTVAPDKSVKVVFSDKMLLHKGQFKHVRTLFDGEILSIIPIDNQGQCEILGMKGFIADGSSALRKFAKKNGLTMEEVMNCLVEGIDGRLHRLGDYKLLCTEDCWKVDKAFRGDYNAYLRWADGMEVMYSGIKDINLLRQAEDVEDEEKVRTVTRSLVQQFMFLNRKQQRVMIKKTCKALKKLLTFSKAYCTLSGSDKDVRTELDRLFERYPQLVMNSAIQGYWKGVFNHRLIAAKAGKYRIDGAYPYIVEDPVAMFEVLLLGKSVDDPDLGVLKEGEFSLADVPDGRKAVLVRYPANDMTALVRTNRACVEEFESLNNVMALSVHDIILIHQDGDVDGDEMAVIFSGVIIALVNEMLKRFNPPTVLFQHGAKGNKPVFTCPEDVDNSIGDCLYKSKKFDGVGRYANLAARCAYLASIAIKRGDVKTAEVLFGYMHAASTGAIMAIDQVKGNVVDPNLVAWLEDIDKKTRKAFANIATKLGVEEGWKVKFHFTKTFEDQDKHRMTYPGTVMPRNEECYWDTTEEMLEKAVGTYDDFNNEGVVFNVMQARKDFMIHNVPDMSVSCGVVSRQMIEALKDHWFTVRKTGDEELDALRDKIHVGNQIGVKDLLKLMWKNEIAASYRMEGASLAQKKNEYRHVCRNVLRAFVDGTRWVEKYGRGGHEDGYEYTSEEKQAILYNYAITDALEMRLNSKTGGVYGSGIGDDKGSYAMFVLGMFAKEINVNLDDNEADETEYKENVLFAVESEVQEEAENMLVVFEDEYIPDESELDPFAYITPDCNIA